MHKNGLLAVTFFVVSILPLRTSAAEANDWRWTLVPPATVDLLDGQRQDIQKYFGEKTVDYRQGAPVVQRLQAWIDLLHAHLLKSDPKYYANIPKPIVRISKQDEIEGFVAGLPVCISQEVNFPNQGSATIDLDLVTLMSSPNSSGIIESRFKAMDPRVCVSQTPSQVARFLSDWAAINPNCKLQSENGSLKVSSECVDENLRNVRHAKRWSYLSSAGVIAVSSRLLELAENEAEVVSTLYHEAGHYYQAHATVGTAERLTYFYDDSHYSGVGRPTPKKELSSLGLSALKTGNLENFSSIPAQKLHPLVWNFMRNLYRVYNRPKVTADKEKLLASCGGSDCRAACDRFFDPDNQWIFELLRNMQKQNINSDDALNSKYAAMEENFLTCGAQIPLAAFGGNSATNPEAFDYYDGNISTALKALGQTAHPRTLGELALTLSAWYQKQQDVVEATAEQNLGYYTVEQDADRLSTLWMSELGLNPNAGIDAEIEFLRQMDMGKYLRPNMAGEAPYDACVDLKNSGWIEENKEVILPVSSFADPHHSSCYRANFIHRVIMGNHLNQVPHNRQSLGNLEWKSFLRKNL
jgi:hypothetical protein